MPSAVLHEKQYNHNKNLLSQPTFDINSSTNLDWIVTIAFYSALHLVEKALASQKTPVHTNEHKTRNKLIFTIDILKPIAKQYHTLYNQSLRARYKCESFSKSDVQDLLKCLEKIESDLP